MVFNCFVILFFILYGFVTVTWCKLFYWLVNASMCMSLILIYWLYICTIWEDGIHRREKLCISVCIYRRRGWRSAGHCGATHRDECSIWPAVYQRGTAPPAGESCYYTTRGPMCCCQKSYFTAAWTAFRYTIGTVWGTSDGFFFFFLPMLPLLEYFSNIN